MSTENKVDAKAYVAGLVKRAQAAQKIAEGFSQEKCDELAAAITYEIVANDPLVKEIAEFAYEECRLGDVQSKIGKVVGKCRGIWYDMKPLKSVGIVEEIPDKGLVRIAKPVGVIANLVPSTQGEMHPIIQAIFIAKTRNATIFAPHPRSRNTTAMITDLLRTVMKKYDAPEDLFLCLENPTIEMSGELMRQCDLVIATGGQNMVRAAYSSGTPAYGVGAGNSHVIVEKTADLKKAIACIKASKTFDLAAGCSCDNSILVQEDVYDAFLEEAKKAGAYKLNIEEKAKVQKAIWPEWPENHIINRHIVASPIENIAKIAGITIPEGTVMLLAEEEMTGASTPLAGEKMCLVSTLYKFKDIEDAIRITNENQAYSGSGHSCAVHTMNEDIINKVALGTYTTRVVVGQSLGGTNGGSWTSGMPFTSSLGCGTWGGNICSENITLKHYINNTWVIREIPDRKPTDKELFAGFTPRENESESLLDKFLRWRKV